MCCCCLKCKDVTVTEQFIYYYTSLKLNHSNLLGSANLHLSAATTTEDSEYELERAASDASDDEAYATERGLAGRQIQTPPTNVDSACLRYVSLVDTCDVRLLLFYFI